MIELRKLTKSFGERRVLDQITTRIAKGEILFILGKSGVGKSVLLKNLVGLMKPDSGEILIDGTEISNLEERDLISIRKKCGMVFQFPALLDSISVYENICFGLRASGLEMKEKEMLLVVEEKLALVKLKREILDRMPNELSFGIQKRVSIARTLAVGPEYLLFDEPTTGMDPVVTTSLNELILSLSRNLKVTSIVVSHDLKSAFKIADRILLLEQGRVAVDGTPEDFRASVVPLAREFLEGVGSD